MQTLEQIQAKSREEQADRILDAANDGRYREAFAQAARLKDAGWLLEVWDAQDGLHVGLHGPKWGPHLCVTFQAPGDSRCTGNIDADGSLMGEPLD